MGISIAVALAIVGVTTSLTTYLSRRGRTITMDEWAVGGRSFGSVLLWFLSAGEIYTTFAFLGAAGWAYQHGAPGFYILANAPLGYALGYWLLPKIWQAGRDHGVMSQGDYVLARFRTPWLATLVAVIGVLALIPYIQVQLTGLTTILTTLFGGAMDKAVGVWIGVALLLVFTFTAGLRSSALASMVKDALVVVAVLAVSLTVGTVAKLGGFGAIFHRMNTEHPAYANLPGLVPASHHGSLWFMSALLITNIGFWMWPHQFQANLAASGAESIRRNAVLQPLYTLSYFFIFVIGFAVLLALPRLGNSNSALVAVVAHYYPPWFVGLLAATGILVALVPSTVMLLTIGTSVARNIYRPRAELADGHRLVAGRLATLLAVLVAAYLTLGSGKTIVELLLVAYSGIAQIGPGLITSLVWRRTSAYGFAAGSIIGLVLIATPPVATWWASVSSIDVGFFAIAVNTVVLIVVSLVTATPDPAAIEVGVPRERVSAY